MRWKCVSHPVEALPTAANGKFRVTLSELPDRCKRLSVPAVAERADDEEYCKLRGSRVHVERSGGPMSRLYEQAFAKVLFPVYESGLRRRRTLDYLAEANAKPVAVARAHCRAAMAQAGEADRALRAHGARTTGSAGANSASMRNRSRAPADYARLPVLRKVDVRANFDALHADGSRGQVYYKTTGGSTGEPMRFGYTRESYDRRIAAMCARLRLGGGDDGAGAPCTCGAHRSAHRCARSRSRSGSITRCSTGACLNAFLMSESRMLEYAGEIESFKPEIIVSYVAPILRMAEWMLATGTRPHRPEAIISAAEALHPAQRETIERAFGCPVFNTYGCREVMLIAAECERRDGLHLTADHLCIELDQPSTSIDGETIGEVVLTDLHNFGMPLLRYGERRPGDHCRRRLRLWSRPRALQAHRRAQARHPAARRPGICCPGNSSSTRSCRSRRSSATRSCSANSARSMSTSCPRPVSAPTSNSRFAPPSPRPSATASRCAFTSSTISPRRPAANSA